MGLNFVRRGPREEFDPPNDFVTVALADKDPDMYAQDEELIYDFEVAVLDEVEEVYRNLDFG